MARTAQPRTTGTKTITRKTAEKPAPSKVPPVIRSKTLDTNEVELANEGKTSFDNGEREDDIPEIEVEGNIANLNEKAARLAFLEEKVTIQISEATDKNAERYVFCSVNGVGPGPGGAKWLPRNMPITLARKYVQVLARARPVNFKNNDYIDQSTGERKVEQIASSTQRYPFTVIHDPNPKGRDWLINLFKENQRR